MSDLKIKGAFLEKLEPCEVLFVVEQKYCEVSSYLPERVKIEILM